MESPAGRDQTAVGSQVVDSGNQKSRLVVWVIMACLVPGIGAATVRPNVLWLTSEDHGPHMGCYGDDYATTPRMDALAERGMTYSFAWSNAPVCAPARSVIISGLYGPATGSEHMRSMVAFPKGKKMFPCYLRDAGYYCTNNSKEDYNLEKTGKVWDESSIDAHWKNRREGQPFFAVFNSHASHESNIRRRPHELRHDPAKVRIPAYHPDTPETRRDWAQYYDIVSEADAALGERLDELEAAGLVEDTIVIFYSDHGSGMPRSKRWPYNSGLQVPMIVFIPEKFQDLRPPDYRPGARTDRLVSFVDLAPTMLSLAGIQPPDWMQGRAFLGEFQQGGPEFVFGFRGRMDERYDLVRSVSDGRYVYIRNFNPHLIYGQRIDYMFETPTTRVWWELHEHGGLNEVQDRFWNTKPFEELYDLENDPDEIRNLAGSFEHQGIKGRLSNALENHLREIRDVGFLPEGERFGRFGSSSPFDLSGDDSVFPFERIFRMACDASNEEVAIGALLAGLQDADDAVRYWAAMGFLIHGEAAIEEGHVPLRAALADESPYVQIVAAEALWKRGPGDDRSSVEEVLSQRVDPTVNDMFVTLAALSAIDAIGVDSFPDLARGISKIRWNPEAPHERYREYAPQLARSLIPDVRD